MNWISELQEALDLTIRRMEKYGSESTYLLVGITEETITLTLEEAKELRTLLDTRL